MHARVRAHDCILLARPTALAGNGTALVVTRIPQSGILLEIILKKTVYEQQQVGDL